MKPHPQMIEGPEAWQRFRDAMRAVVAVPKSAILKAEKRHARAVEHPDNSPHKRGPKSKRKADWFI